MKLQLALDVVDLEKAISLAEKTNGLVDIVEAGTPLIKSVGLQCVEKLKKYGPVLADMKTADCGYLETKLAKAFGANYTTVLGFVNDETIIGAVNAAKEEKIKVMIDLIGVKNKLKRARELERIGVDYILVHTGIDEQKAGKNPIEEIKEIGKSINIPLACAGGLNAESIPNIVDINNLEIIIVGGAITKAIDPRLACEEIKEVIK